MGTLRVLELVGLSGCHPTLSVPKERKAVGVWEPDCTHSNFSFPQIILENDLANRSWCIPAKRLLLCAWRPFSGFSCVLKDLLVLLRGQCLWFPGFQGQLRRWLTEPECALFSADSAVGMNSDTCGNIWLESNFWTLSLAHLATPSSGRCLAKGKPGFPYWS